MRKKAPELWKKEMSELFQIWPHWLLACGLNLSFHYGCSP